ncbi:IMP dehydrogenase, partial [Burkholderia pseudomallei]
MGFAKRLIQHPLTFEDVLLVPAFSDVLPRVSRLGTQLTRIRSVTLPLVAGARDTVTEGGLARARA